jgi:hypothetical protein
MLAALLFLATAVADAGTADVVVDQASPRGTTSDVEKRRLILVWTEQRPGKKRIIETRFELFGERMLYRRTRSYDVGEHSPYVDDGAFLVVHPEKIAAVLAAIAHAPPGVPAGALPQTGVGGRTAWLSVTLPDENGVNQIILSRRGHQVLGATPTAQFEGLAALHDLFIDIDERAFDLR